MSTLHWATGTVRLLVESFYSPSGVQPESNRSPPGVQPESTRSPTGVHQESTWSPTGVQQESTWSPSGVHEESNQSPSGVQLESTKNPPGVHQESTRSPSGVHIDWLNHEGLRFEITKTKCPHRGSNPGAIIWLYKHTNARVITTQPCELENTTQWEPYIPHVAIL